MRQALHQLQITTNGQALVDVTVPIRRFVTAEGVTTGLLTVWCRHTSASLLVQENADPTVQADLLAFFRRVVPEGDAYHHQDEGPDDMPAHIKAALTQVSVGIPIMRGRLVLGTWQGLYLFEHRDRPHRREIVLHLSI